MLVLSRKKNESLMIGDVEVLVVDIRGDKVRLGIVAPRDVPVHRREVFDAIQREGERRKLDRDLAMPKPTLTLNQESSDDAQGK